MTLRKFLTWNDIPDNTIKKIVFVILGIILHHIGIFIGIRIKFPNDFLSRFYSLFVLGIGFLYFVFPVIWLSYNKSIYYFKNKILGIIFPFLFNWSSFIVYIVCDRTVKIAFVSLILAYVGYIFSGFRTDLILNRVLHLGHNFFNWTFSRFFFITFIFINWSNTFNILYNYLKNL